MFLFGLLFFVIITIYNHFIICFHIFSFSQQATESRLVTLSTVMVCPLCTVPPTDHDSATEMERGCVHTWTINDTQQPLNQNDIVHWKPLKPVWYLVDPTVSVFLNPLNRSYCGYRSYTGLNTFHHCIWIDPTVPPTDLTYQPVHSWNSQRFIVVPNVGEKLTKHWSYHDIICYAPYHFLPTERNHQYPNTISYIYVLTENNSFCYSVVIRVN